MHRLAALWCEPGMARPRPILPDTERRAWEKMARRLNATFSNQWAQHHPGKGAEGRPRDADEP